MQGKRHGTGDKRTGHAGNEQFAVAEQHAIDERLANASNKLGDKISGTLALFLLVTEFKPCCNLHSIDGPQRNRSGDQNEAVGTR